MKQLLNEESIRMQRLAGIDPTNETFESVLKEFIEVIDEHTYSLNEETLNESLWEKAKYYLGKLGRYKANGKIFGKGKIDDEALDKIKGILDKEGNNIIKQLDANIKKYNPEFPNNEESKGFVKTCLEIAKIYDGIVDATEKKEDEEGFMPVDAANALITDLREYIKDILDRQLAAAYSVTNEAREKVGDTDNYDKRAAKDLLKRRAGEEEFDSERMKTLKSWKLPLSLLTFGGAAGGLGWFWDALKEKGETLESIKSLQNVTGVKNGEGFTQILNRAFGENLGPDSKLSDVKDIIKNKIGDGDYNKGLEILTKEGGIFEDPEKAKLALSNLNQSDSFDNRTSLKDFFKENFAGTGKNPGDMLVTKPGGMLAKMILKTVTKTAIKKGAAASILAPILKVLGVAAVVGSAVTALARLKGRKSSRAAVLNNVYQSLKNIKPTEDNKTLVDVPVVNEVPPTDKAQTGEKPAEKTTDTQNQAKPKIAPDVAVIKRDFDNNTAVKTALGKIGSAEEFRDFILQMSQFVSANLRKDKANLKSALYGIANRLKSKIKEDYSLPADVDGTNNAIQATKALVQHLQKVNTREEFADLILSVLPYIDPEGKITADRKKLVNTIYSAANQIDKFVANRDKDPAKRPGGLG